VDYLQAVILGIVEGLTEFLPVSSTGHLTITEKILGLKIDDAGVTAYTAVIQMGAILAVLLYFRGDIGRIAVAWLRGLVKPEYRGSFDHRFGWYIIAGSVPIGIVGFLGKDVITGPLRSLWWVGGALVVWSAVIWLAEHNPAQDRGERDLTMTDALVVGAVQCVSLVPGVSRSGATATRLSFFLSIPALTAAGLYELKDVPGSGIGAGQTLVGTAVSFVVAYAAVAWLLRFVAHHSIAWFVPYRVALGLVVLGLLVGNVISAT
jgi:undecaprenyl-diphosphatase